jgi:hypothetical protein
LKFSSHLPAIATQARAPSGCSSRTTEDCARSRGRTLSAIRWATSERSSDSVSDRALRASSSAWRRRAARSSSRRRSSVTSRTSAAKPRTVPWGAKSGVYAACTRRAVPSPYTSVSSNVTACPASAACTWPAIAAYAVSPTTSRTDRPATSPGRQPNHCSYARLANR